VPQWCRTGIRLFDYDGDTALIELTATHDKATTECFAFHEASKTLLAGGTLRQEPVLFAVHIKFAKGDPPEGSIRWSTSSNVEGCYGVVVLDPDPDAKERTGSTSAVVVSSSSHGGGELQVRKLSNGDRVQTLDVSTHGSPTFLAADHATSTVFASQDLTEGVWSYKWDVASQKLLPLRAIETTAGIHAICSIAVVPRAPGSDTAYLLACACDGTIVSIFALPSCTKIHQYYFEGMKVRGLAAEPHGSALAVCDDRGQCVHVVAWPLPGMPVLA
jgi:hypothetical protein